MGVVVHHVAHPFAGGEDLRFSHRRWCPSGLRKQISTEQSLRRCVEQYAAIPAVRNVRRVEPLQLAATDGELFAVSEPTRGPVGKVVERCQYANFSAKRRRSRCRFQKVVQRAKFVALEVRPANPAQLLDWYHLVNGFQGVGEHLAPSGVEQQRFVVNHQVGIEGESARNYVQGRTDAIDSSFDFVDTGACLFVYVQV